MEEEMKKPIDEALAAEDSAAVAEESAPAAEAQETMEDYEAELNASFRQIKEGDTLKGTVVGVDEDKVTVDINYYTSGIIEAADVSNDPSFSIKDNIQVGQEIEATVIHTDDGHGHIQLSMKEAAANAAWDHVRSLLESKEAITVKISGITKAGAIASIDGIRAFIPASKLSLGYVPEDDLVNWIGREIEVRVITADEKDNRLVLSAKEILREKEAEERKKSAAAIHVGAVLEGTVETLKDYGAFVSLAKGVTGLLHVSQISSKRIKTPSEVLKSGQTIKVKVTKVADGRISLSMKGLEDAPSEAVDDEPAFKLPKSEDIGTGLGALLKNIKLN
jgi:small subunit ribosomal protein S1